jgi:hypothetical protein
MKEILNLFSSNWVKYFVYNKVAIRLLIQKEKKPKKLLKNFSAPEKELLLKKLKREVQVVCLVSIFQYLQLV